MANRFNLLPGFRVTSPSPVAAKLCGFARPTPVPASDSSHRGSSDDDFCSVDNATSAGAQPCTRIAVANPPGQYFGLVYPV